MANEKVEVYKGNKKVVFKRKRFQKSLNRLTSNNKMNNHIKRPKKKKKKKKSRTNYGTNQNIR